MAENDVASHYNALPERGLEERNRSRIVHLRSFNNWVKSVLIGECVQSLRRSQRELQLDVLDMACGKGGDLLKWRKAEISSLVCADIAEVSLEQCKGRYEEMRQRAAREKRGPRLFSTQFVHADCAEVRLQEKYRNGDQRFNIASVQFSLHYGFETEQRARRMVQNACECLLPGGYFIGTIPDANRLVHKLRNSAGTSFSNEVYKVEFATSYPDGTQPPLFGAKYWFSLHEVVDCPEYLVHMPLLERNPLRILADNDAVVLESPPS